MRLARIFRSAFRVLRYLLICAYFLVSLGVGAIVHLSLPASRSAAAQILESYLNGLLRGSIKIGSISRIVGGNLDFRDVQVRDPDGRLVLSLEHLGAKVDPYDIIRRSLASFQKLSIEIQRISAGGLQVHLLATSDRDEKGQLLSHPSLSDAFTPRPRPGSGSTGESRPLRIWMPAIVIRDAAVDGIVDTFTLPQSNVERAKAQILITDKGLLLDVDSFDLFSSRLLGGDATARGDFHLRLPGPIYGEVVGRWGAIPLECKYRFDDKNLQASAKFPQLAPPELRSLLGSWPIDATLTATLEAKGKLPTLKVEARAAVIDDLRTEAFAVTASGEVLANQKPSAKLDVVTHGLDLSRIIHTLPRSRLNTESQLTITVNTSTDFNIETSTHLTSGTLAEHVLPPTYVQSTFGPSGLTSETTVSQPGLALTLLLNLPHDAPLNWDAEVRDLNTKSVYLKQYLSGITGRLQGRLAGSLNATGELQAHAILQGFEVGYQEASANHIKLTTDLSGDPLQPLKLAGVTHLEASQISVGDYKLKSFTLDQKGLLGEPSLQLTALSSRGFEIAATAQANLAEQAVSNLQASLEESHKPISFQARMLSYKNGTFTARDFAMRSVGEITGDIEVSGRTASINAKARGLSISRLSERLGLSPGELEGELDGDIQLKLAEQSAGMIDISVKNGAYKGLVSVTANVRSKIDGKNLVGTAVAQIPGLGRIHSQLDATLGGVPLSLHAFTQATGKLKTELKQLDLKTLSILLGVSKTVTVAGEAELTLEATRQDRHEPKLTLSTQTQGVSALWTGKDGTLHALENVDANGISTFNMESELLEGALRLEDPQGELVSVSGNIAVPLVSWWQNSATFSQMSTSLLTAPLNLVAIVPERKVKRFPSALALPFSDGSLGARLNISGTPSNPSIGVVVDAERLSMSGEGGFTRPLDFHGNARYSAQDGSLLGSIQFDDEGSTLGTLSAELNLPYNQLVHSGTNAGLAWSGGAQLQLEGFPLDIIQAAASHQIHGKVDGTITIDRSQLIPQISSSLRARQLVAAGHSIGTATFELNNQSEKLFAKANLNDEYGELEARVQMVLASTSDGIGLSKAVPLLLELESKRYNAAAVAPILQGVFDEISGTLDGKLHLELYPPKAGAEAEARMFGELKLSHGTLRPSSVGIKMEEVGASLSLKPEAGLSVLRLNNIEAHVGSDTPNLKANALLRLKNLQPQSGNISLEVNKLPVLNGTAQLATLTGKAVGELKAQADGLLLSVKISKLLAQLAEGVDDQLIDLTENAAVDIVQLPKKQIETEVSSSNALLMRVDLGDDARIKHSLMDVRVSGQPEVSFGGIIQIRGGISVKRGGRFVVLGRSFLVDRGLVSFDTADLNDPHLQIGATWTAPNNMIVRLDVGGTVSAPTLSWSSEPSVPGGEAEILALVIGAGSSSAGVSSGASIALVANELSNIEGLEFYTTQQSTTSEGRVASLNDSSWDSYTASYQINDKLWFEGSYQKQSNSATTTAGAHNAVSGTLDWRFLPQWSLRTEMGTLGMGLDMLWQYRY